MDKIDYFIRKTLGQIEFDPVNEQKHLRFEMSFSVEHSSIYQNCGSVLRLFNKWIGNGYLIEFHKGGCQAYNLNSLGQPYRFIDGDSGIGTCDIIRMVLNDAGFTEDDIPLDIIRDFKLRQLGV